MCCILQVAYDCLRGCAKRISDIVKVPFFHRRTAKLSCQLRHDGQTFVSLIGDFSTKFATLQGEGGQTFLPFAASSKTHIVHASLPLLKV
jgi:hypothetical protein